MITNNLGSRDIFAIIALLERVTTVMRIVESLDQTLKKASPSSERLAALRAITFGIGPDLLAMKEQLECLLDRIYEDGGKAA